MSATTPPKRHNPKAWANYGCKGTIKFADVQEKSHFSAIFLVWGVECKGRNLLGGVPPSTKPVVGIKHVHSALIRAQLLVNYLRILGNLFRIPVNLFRKAVNCFRTLVNFFRNRVKHFREQS